MIIVLFALLLASALLAKETAENDYRPGDQSVLVLPTAYNIPAGKITFTNYQILTLHFTFSFIDRLDIGAVFPFPIDKEFVDYMTPGFK